MNPKNEKGNTMKNHRQPGRLAVLAVLLLVTVGSLVTLSAAQAKMSPITIAQLAGPWQIALIGTTGCGSSSLLFTGTLNSSGTAVGTLIGSSGCGLEGTSTQTLTIRSLGANGSGVANLTCGSNCGWDFFIQVSPNKQVFNLVDLDASNNYLGGTAVKQ
jgi:hypothetical protein